MLLGLVALLMFTGCAGSTSRSAESLAKITVAAASDVRPAFEELGSLFLRETGVQVTFSFGSSGQLAQQIIQGAPFDVFASANMKFVDDVIASGMGVDSTKANFAMGRLALIVAAGNELPDTVNELESPRFRRVAIANPVHAPYGLAAEQALQRAGVLAQARKRLIFGENIADTMRIVSSGNADVGIVALSLAIAGDVDYTLVPANLHAPLEQTLVLTTVGARTRAASDFASFLQSDISHRVLARYGFEIPRSDRQLDGGAE